MEQRFLSPSVLAGISGLELVAKTVVDGFVAGMHRSPDFGFSQEFAEYRSYTPGDDLRHVDWNVFARTEKAYLKRYRGETNSQLTILLDVSASMGFGSGEVNKLDYGRYLAASLLYLAQRQRDAGGLIIFDDDVRNYVPPSSRQGQLARLLHALDSAQLGQRTDFSKPFYHLQSLIRRRGIVVLISDLYEEPERIVKTVEPLRYHGTELVLLHVMDPHELNPSIDQARMMVDMETSAEIEVSPQFLKNEYPARVQSHIEALRSKAKASGIDYFLLRTDRPLDECLREYITIRKGRM